MSVSIRSLLLSLLVIMPMMAACTSGGDEAESKFANALSDINSNWELYEISESRGAIVIKVEVPAIVSFKDGKKAVDAINKVDPKFAGYIDFYDTKTGMVVRKMEVLPSS